MKKEIKLGTFIISFLIFLSLLFQNILEQYFSMFKALDEVIPILLLFILVIKLIRNKGKLQDVNKGLIKNNMTIIIAMIVIFIVGISGNLIYKYQSMQATVSDMIIVFKGFITYILAAFIFYDISLEKYKKTINNTLRIIAIACFIGVGVNYFIEIFPVGDIRYGIESQKLLFTETTYLASFTIAIIALLTFYINSYKSNIYYIIVLSLVVISTLRSKAIVFIIIYLLLYFIIIVKEFRLNKKIGLYIGVAGTFVGGKQIITYLTNTEWARSALSITSVKIANDHFPIGAGFATFATWNSGVHYSPLYYIYDLSTTYGLEPTWYYFVADTYWPAIIGQFGYIGLVAVLVIIMSIYKNIVLQNDKYKYFQQLSILIYLLILSTSETSFMSPMGTLLCLVLAL